MPGTAFAARAFRGEPRGQSGLQLNVLVNPEDVSRLVVLDTWTLNCDRHHHGPTFREQNPDNVYMSSEELKQGNGG